MNAADHYLTDRVMTASPAQLTDMLFQGAVAALRGAARLQEAGDFAGALPRSLKAQRILMELRTSLDHGAGGELTATSTGCTPGRTATSSRPTPPATPRAPATPSAWSRSLATAWRESCVGVAAPVPA